MVDRIDRDLTELSRQLKKLDEKATKRVMNTVNRKAIQVAVDRATDIALSRFQSEGFLASQITRAKGRKKLNKITDRLGVAGGARKPEDDKTTRSITRTRGGIRLKTSTRKRKGKGDAYYWRFLEFGTSKMVARPFLRPAWESTRSAMLRVAVREAKKGIEREARRLKKV